mgnify:CR=1 FL=1
MKGFHFRPQAALDLRRKRADAAERELAQANARTEAAHLALDAARTRCTEACREARDEQACATGIDTLVWHHHWIDAQRRESARREEELQHRRREAQVALEQATRARVDVRALERLRERALQVFVRDAERAEQKSIDWLAVLRAARTTREREELT